VCRKRYLYHTYAASCAIYPNSGAGPTLHQWAEPLEYAMGSGNYFYYKYYLGTPHGQITDQLCTTLNDFPAIKASLNANPDWGAHYDLSNSYYVGFEIGTCYYNIGYENQYGHMVTHGEPKKREADCIKRKGVWVAGAPLRVQYKPLLLGDDVCLDRTGG